MCSGAHEHTLVTTNKVVWLRSAGVSWRDWSNHAAQITTAPHEHAAIYASKFFTYLKSCSCFACRVEGEKIASVVGFLYCVCLIRDETPTKFSHEPCKDAELLDTILFSRLCSAGQNAAARLLISGLRLLKIFLGCKCIVTECDWRLRGWQIPSSQMCCFVLLCLWLAGAPQ